MATAAARRYARATFELATMDGQVDEWRRRISAVRDLLTEPAVAAVLTNPSIAASRRMSLISGAPHVLDPEATNLARLLIESNRVGDIGEIVAEYDRLADEAAGLVRATVTTAIALSAADRERVTAELSRRLGQTVKLEVVVDQQILGGMKLQYGDRIVDVTIATKLQQLRRRLASLS